MIEKLGSYFVTKCGSVRTHYYVIQTVSLCLISFCLGLLADGLINSYQPTHATNQTTQSEPSS